MMGINIYVDYFMYLKDGLKRVKHQERQDMQRLDVQWKVCYRLLSYMILTSSKVPLSLGILQNCVAFLVDIEYFIAPVLASAHPILYLF
jgi:hypothetical protein